MSRKLVILFMLLLAGLPCVAATAASSAVEKVEIAVAMSFTGEMSGFGNVSLEGVQLAVEEANASGRSPRIELKVYDNKSSEETGKEVAAQIVASPAVLVVGPSSSRVALAAGPVFAQGGLASITTTATSDLITDKRARAGTTFRILFKNSEQGEMLANYLYHVLGQKRASVLVVDDQYGRTLENGFRIAAERLGIDATYYSFKSGENLEGMALASAAEIAQAPVVLAMLEVDGAKVLPILRRLGVQGPFLGDNAFGVEDFATRFADLPEEKLQPGFFCEGLYRITPMLLDSANAELLQFAERFKARFGHNPGWVAVTGYDAARAAIEAVRGMDAKTADVAAMRAAALKYLLSLNDPLRAPVGLLGPIAFDAERGRQTAIRMGRFNRGRFESAPLQIVPVLNPHTAEKQSGAVFETKPGKYVRLQQVIYSGMYLNEIMWIDQSRFTFAADFYVWIRFVKNTSPEAADPTDIKFPDMSAGRFYRETPVEQREMSDGTSYRLWRVQGEFRNPFDLHRYPFDRQTLTLRFFNARAAADRIVYALDQGTWEGTDETKVSMATSGAATDAFRNLTQWKPLGLHQWRQNFVAQSSLGDPRRIGRQNDRELSGYGASIELQRRSLNTLAKTLLPLWLMTCILYASLHFPPVLVQPKIGVAMTAVLTGVVLLNLVNSQLGSIGYTIAIEYAFYVYFALGLLQIVSVLFSEHLRAVGRVPAANRFDIWTRVIFLGAVGGLFMVAFLYK